MAELQAGREEGLLNLRIKLKFERKTFNIENIEK